MKRHSWMVGAGALLLVALAAGVGALLSQGGSGSSRASPAAIPGPGGGGAVAGKRDGSRSSLQRPAADGIRRPAAATAAAGAQAAPPPTQQSAVPETSPGPRLRLSDRGQPIVWLRRGERISLRTKPGGKVVKSLRWRTQFGSRTVLAVFTHRGGWAGVPAPQLPNGRLGWVKLDPALLRSGWTRYSIHVDLSSKSARLVLGKRALRSFAVTVGSPASPTPTGRFAITDMFRGNLNPAYGCCALATTATQASLPSGWLGGNRIAIHGTTGPLGVAISHGCIRAPNGDVSALVDRVGLGTPVVVRQ